jgi:hypothetical protein
MGRGRGRPLEQAGGENKIQGYGVQVQVTSQEAKYVESWPNTTSAWAGWSRFDIPVDRHGAVHSLLICTSSILGFPTEYTE